MLRFFALADSYPKFSRFSRSVSDTLDEYMAEKRDEFPESEREEKLTNFINMTDFVKNNFVHGFMKGPSKDVSRIFFEAVSVGVFLVLKERPDIKIAKKIDVTEWFKEKEFKVSVNIRYKTHSSENLNRRIDFVKNRILELAL